MGAANGQAQQQQFVPQQQQFVPQGQAVNQAAQQQAAFVAQEAPRGANAGQQLQNSDLISESKECAIDVKRICPESMLSSNYHILNCLAQQKDDTDLSDECHTVSSPIHKNSASLIFSRRFRRKVPGSYSWYFCF